MAESFKNTVVNSFIWKFLEQCGAGGAQLIIGIILARLLLPEDYAILIIATVFITLSQIFIDSGFSSALIQKKEITDADTSSVFYISLCVSILLYGVIFLASPFIADIYDEPLLIPVLRVLSLTLLIGVISSMQKVFISRNFQFKKQFIVSIIAALISGIVGIVLAFLGYGVWALVGQQLTSAILIALTLQILVGWKPKLLFSLTHAKSLFSFGWKLLVSSLIHQMFDSIRNLTIGAFYNKASLAFYNKGEEYPKYLSTSLDGTVQAVLFPAYAKYQDDKKALKFMLSKALSTNAFITFPAMFGLAAVAEPFVSLLLTDKWLFCVPFLQIFCIYYALQPITSANLAAIKAIGRTDTLLRLEIIKKIIAYGCLICTLPFGVMTVAVGALVSKTLAVLINGYPNTRLLGYTYKEMLKDLCPFILLSAIMAGIVYSIQFLGFSALITLCIQIPVGIIFYFGAAKLLRMKTLDFAVSTVLDYVKSLRK